MAGKRIPPEAQLFSARVRTGDKRAVRRVIATLQRRNGNMEATAIELGIAPRTLYLWRDTIPELGEKIREHARGRVGRPATTTGSS